MSDIILPHGAQADGSIVDVYGNRLSNDERLKIREQVAGLPATGMKDDIIHAVQNNTVVIIDGETGSGKTTQIGKMLFNPKKQIIITQPRVLSAMSNADRVSKELMAEKMCSSYSLGHKVGYRTGRGVSSSRISPLSFNTDGLELMRMAYSGLVPDVLVLDEVHNFAIPTEMLAMLMKYKQNIKIIIMSATLDSGIFQEYFRHISSDIPVIKIPGRTHPVTKVFGMADNYVDTIANQYNQGKNILFFVPGKREIEDEIKLLRMKFGPDAEIFPLHADLPKEEQQKLLTKTTDKPRIIVCTNVAEESITIPYIDVVVDKGTHKVARYNNYGIQELRLENTAQANCLQRAGRAGRTKPGEYFRVNDIPFEELDVYPEAPMEREMLDKYILILLANNIDIEKLYEEEALNDRKLFFHDFNSNLLRISYKRLAQIGAIDRTKKITPLGLDLLKFPLDIYNARMLREAIKRKCVEDMIYATAILEKKGFVSKDEEWKEIKMLGAKDSDLFGYTDLFKLLTATTLPSAKIELLAGLGIIRDELNDFMDRGGEYKLYELVDLSPIGIKNKKIKEIDELIMTLRKRLTDSGIEITSSSNMNDRKICLASGSLHNIYKYDPKMKMFHNRESKLNDDTLYFKAGNVTLVEPTAHHFYLGQPFIIGGGEFSGDLNLLTFLTQVDDGHIHDAKLSTQSLIAHTHPKPSEEKDKSLVKGEKATHSTSKKETTTIITETTKGAQAEGSSEKVSYDPVFKDEISSIDSDKELRNQARMIEKDSKAETRNNFFQTQEDPVMYYLRYRVPDILIIQNQRISNYLKDKSEDDIFTFKELLVRFLLEDEAYRINLKTKASIAKTEKSFRHDTIIFDRFMESTDPFIRAFRKGNKVVLPSEEKELIVGTFNDENSQNLVENHELREFQGQYATLIGTIKNKMKEANEDRVKMEILREYFLYLELSSIELQTIDAIYRDIGKMKSEEVKKGMIQLKGVEKNVKILKKAISRKGEILNSTNAIENIINGTGGKIDLQSLKTHKFGSDFSDKYISKYNNTLRLTQSKDKRQRQRGIEQLKYIAIDMNAQLIKLQKEIESLTAETNLSSIPNAGIIRDNLEMLFKDFFEEDYYKAVISGKLLDITREIIRDQVTEKKGLHKILFQSFNTLDMAHTKEKKELFRSIESYKDTLNVLEIYSDSIYHEVKETMDVEKVQSRIQELQTKIQEFQTRRDILVKNSIAFR